MKSSITELGQPRGPAQGSSNTSTWQRRQEDASHQNQDGPWAQISPQGVESPETWFLICKMRMTGLDIKFWEYLAIIDGSLE